jgi:DNA-binding transcriptional regulator/RsmH inhibitor MraZ
MPSNPSRGGTRSLCPPARRAKGLCAAAQSIVPPQAASSAYGCAVSKPRVVAISGDSSANLSLGSDTERFLQTGIMKKTRGCRVSRSGLVTIDAPLDIGEKAERAVRQLGKYQAACIWCAHGYDEYSPKAEDEHFAYNCPEAPEELRDNAKRRLRGAKRCTR